MVIKVYISCCGGDKSVAVVEKAMKLSGVQAQIEVVKDYAEIAKAGIISTPAIQVKEQVVVSGRVPKVQELADYLIKATAR